MVSIPEGGFRPALYLSDPVKIGARSDATFGLLSDIEVSGTQGIVVMDYQTSEIRRFRRSGEELTLLAGPGGGPGEIGRAIGIAVQRNGTVWVNDFGNARFSRFPSDSVPGSVHVGSVRVNGLEDGGVTDGGQPWVRQSRVVDGRPDPEGGLTDATVATYLVRVDVGENASADSIFLGTSHVFSADLPQRRGSRKVRFTNDRLVAFDPAGAVWTAESDRFRLVRLSLSGDTTLVVDVEAQPVQIPEDVRRGELATLEDWFRSVGAVVPSLEEAIPRIYPLVERLLVDSRGTVWVQHRDEQGIVFDRLTADGEPAERIHIRDLPGSPGKSAVGEDLLAMIVVDSLDVQSLLAWQLRF